MNGIFSTVNGMSSFRGMQDEERSVRCRQRSCDGAIPFHYHLCRPIRTGAITVKAVYDQIYNDLLEQIETGKYPCQSFIPPESELVDIYSCSHSTVRRAIRLLAQGGYVQPINGKGVRVIWLPAEREVFKTGGIETFKEAAERSRLKAVTKVLSLSSMKS